MRLLLGILGVAVNLLLFLIGTSGYIWMAIYGFSISVTIIATFVCAMAVWLGSRSIRYALEDK